MFQSLDASLGLKDLPCIQYAQYLCYSTVTPPSNDLPLGLLNASHFSAHEMVVSGLGLFVVSFSECVFGRDIFTITRST